jgi:D-alanyl-D-alanine dipeptidase
MEATRHTVTMLALLAVLGTTGCVHAERPPILSPAQSAAQANLVDIRTLVPDIAEDIKYAGSENFVHRWMVTSRRSACCCVRWPPRWRMSSMNCARASCG